MSRGTFRKNTNVKLPLALQKELGLQGQNGFDHRAGRHGPNPVAARKEQRRVSRHGRKRGGLRHVNGHTLDDREKANGYEDESDNNDDYEVDGEDGHEDIGSGRNRSSVSTGLSTSKTGMVLPKSKSVQKVTTNTAQQVQKATETSDLSGSDSSRASSPGLVLDPNSRSFKKHAQEDDDEIAALERRLGIKGKKRGKLNDDMLDFVLEDLDGEPAVKKRKREGQEWLNQKRMRVQEDDDVSGPGPGANGFSDQDDLDLSNSDNANAEIDDFGSVHESESNTDNDLDDVEEEGLEEEESKGDDFAGFESGSDLGAEMRPIKKARENPYIAPAISKSMGTKYVPPSLRRQSQSDGSGLDSLTRLLQGQLNKLSEANMISILGEIEKIYRTNPRQDVTTVLIERILTSFCIRSALQNTFIILHAAFLAAVYKVMGTDFGAEVLVKVVERFDTEYQSKDAGKEALNLVSLLANLFTFNVVSSNIIYDHIRLLMTDFDESNAELLLRIVRDCGPQLRSDDPAALKDIAQALQNISADAARNGQSINTRTRVMIDTIVDLKNNKLKNATNAVGLHGEHITRMRKALGSLNNRTLKATEPLRITRDDIANSDKKGKWWLVGASWKGHEAKSNTTSDLADNILEDEPESIGVEEEINFLALAKQYRMNTDVRRSIFVAIMSADDCRDAQMRLLKLRLSSKQEQEVAKVLLRCARAEPAYNPYYALLAKNLCKDKKRIRIGFQFGLWDFFGRLGEKADEDESDGGRDGDSDIELHEIVNVAKMYAYLIFHEYLTIGILKTLNIGFLKEQTTMFLETLLVSIMTQPKANEEELMRVFSKVADTPQLAKPLGFFLKKNVKKSDLASGKEKMRIKEGCQIAVVAFKMIGSTEVG